MQRGGWMLSALLGMWAVSGCHSSDSTQADAASASKQSAAASQSAQPRTKASNSKAKDRANDGAAAELAVKATPPPAGLSGPAKAVFEFLEAVRIGHDSKAGQMLTPLARQKIGELGLDVAPPGSEKASFRIGEVEMIAEDAAHVDSTWSDEENGKQQTDSILWVLRHEPEGWRIAGMATKIFEEELPLLLDFEDPEDMLRKQELAEQEIERRAKAAQQQARQRSADTLDQQ